MTSALMRKIGLPDHWGTRRDLDRRLGTTDNSMRGPHIRSERNLKPKMQKRKYKYKSMGWINFWRATQKDTIKLIISTYLSCVLSDIAILGLIGILSTNLCPVSTLVKRLKRAYSWVRGLVKMATAQLGYYGLSNICTWSINQVLELMWQANKCGK